MTKQEFIDELRARLSKLPNIDTEERLRFYEEMINDRMEEGLSEEEAIDDIGPIDMIYDQIAQDAPKNHLRLDKTRQKVESRRRKKIIIISSTAIVWAPILVALVASAFAVAVSLIAVAVSLYVVLWSLVVVAWAVFASFAVSAPCGVILGILNILNGNILPGISLIGCGMVLAGLAIFAFYGSLYATKGSVILTKKIISGIKKAMNR